MLYLFNEQVDQSFLALAVADLEGVFGMAGHEADNKQDAVADTG